jgi:hypothetical protein
MNIRRLSFFALAAAIGVSTFGLLWLPKATAAGTYCNPTGTATMCYKGSTVNNVPPPVQLVYSEGGGTCGACTTTQLK